MKAYRCQHSGLLLPPDYREQWGILYGHGLGPEPVSECLNSIMSAKIDLRRANYTQSPDRFMFPFHHTKAAIDLVEVTQAEYDNPDNRMILSCDDVDFTRRCDILRKNQSKKPEWSKLDVAGSGQRQEERTVWR